MKILAGILLIISLSKLLNSLTMKSEDMSRSLDIPELKGIIDPNKLILVSKLIIITDTLIGVLCALFILFV